MNVSINRNHPFRYGVYNASTGKRVSRHRHLGTAFKKAISVQSTGMRVIVR